MSDPAEDAGTQATDHLMDDAQIADMMGRHRQVRPCALELDFPGEEGPQRLLP